MKSRVSQLLVIFVVGLLAIVAAWQIIENRRLSSINRENLKILTAATGQLAAAMMRSSAGDQFSIDPNLILVPLGMSIVSQPFDMESLPADSFSGLCVLAANSDFLFASKPGMALASEANRVVRDRLHALQPRIWNESSARSQRAGDAHQCELTRPAKRS
jgi:hypothetical protein